MYETGQIAWTIAVAPNIINSKKKKKLIIIINVYFFFVVSILDLKKDLNKFEYLFTIMDRKKKKKIYIYIYL